MHEGLQDYRILIVEDEAMIALDLEMALIHAGCTVVGPMASLAQALGHLDDAPFDAALLDVNLNGELIFPLAELLAARRIPFVFMTGYAELILPLHFRQRPICRKPCDPRRPLKALELALAA
jgi:DNA-binding response OmpR family regulator